ncbi:ParB/RepB/Spo0J family partition protein [Pseudomonas eucalypticola]|uniref:ParB/RepB/Spo0J family partition protein n=1 Tax=Pseudomonas eucalypticola TaxID=2599595 RepID=A0A7D5H447_9PSED|nr:ParB/RepB/Spo0J family partition protein [Pseudomonas eucalypticola]QKZ07847.1 ParB/RepB/Spo0J family partition protein [Pseudomonas eucalypticola]
MAKKLDLLGLADFGQAPAPAAAGEDGQVIEVAVDDVIPDPAQPRKKFDPVKLQKLADVIKASRLNQPVTVRPKNADGKYVIGLGERRWRACKIAGLATLPVRISAQIDYYDQVTENTEQEPLTIMEEARFIAWRVAEGDKKSLIAKRLGMRADTVSQLLALATAPEFIQVLGDEKAIGGRTLYELVQAHKEFPAEVERYAQGEEITRAGVGRLLEQLRSREAQALIDAEAKAGQQHNDQSTNQDTKPPKVEGDRDKERPLDLDNPNEKPAGPAQPAAAAQQQASAPGGAKVKILVNGRAATLAQAGLVQVVYADTGEIVEVELSTVQIVGVEETDNESS